MEKIGFFLVGVFLCIYHPSSAQIQKGHYLPFGLGYTFQTVKDVALSPVSYSGNLGNLSGGYHYYNSNWISALDINGFGAFLYPNVNRENNPNSATAISARANYSLSRRVYSLNQWHFFAGLVSQNIWDYRGVNRYANSSFNFDAFFSLGPILTVQKPFELWGKSFELQYNLSLPFATYAWRPGFIKPLLAGSVGNKELYFWGDYYNIDSKVEFIWRLKNSNFLKLSYQWEYTQLNPVNKLQMANHTLTLSTFFKF